MHDVRPSFIEKMAAARRQLAEDRANGRVRVVPELDLNFPGYVASYCQAARAVLSAAEEANGARLPELAFPCVRLQRHTVELLLKRILTVCDSIAQSRIELEARANPGAHRWRGLQSLRLQLVANYNRVVYRAASAIKGLAIPSPGQRRITHDLRKLRRLARKALSDLGSGWELPSEFSKLISELQQFAHDETWLEYETGKKERRSFVDDAGSCAARTACLRDWQASLEALVACDLLRELAAEAEACEQTILIHS